MTILKPKTAHRLLAGLAACLILALGVTASSRLVAEANGNFVAGQLDQVGKQLSFAELIEKLPALRARSERAQSLAPEHPEFAQTHGELLTRYLVSLPKKERSKPLIDEARIALSKAIALRPETPFAHAYLAWLELTIAEDFPTASNALVNALQRGRHERNLRMALIENGVRHWYAISNPARQALIEAMTLAADDPRSRHRIKTAEYASSACLYQQLHHDSLLEKNPWCEI